MTIKKRSRATLKALSLLLCAQSVMSITAPPDLQSKITAKAYCLDNIGAPPSPASLPRLPPSSTLTPPTPAPPAAPLPSPLIHFTHCPRLLENGVNFFITCLTLQPYYCSPLMFSVTVETR